MAMEWKDMLNYIYYNSKKPELLSKKQIVSRLYKQVLRMNYNHHLMSGNLGHKYIKQEYNNLREEFQ